MALSFPSKAGQYLALAFGGVFMKRTFITLLALALAGPAAAADLAARQITAENASEMIPAGPDAHAGVGDWLLSNGTLCAAISNLNRESDLATTGGALSDLGFCGRADDAITSFHDMLGPTPVRADRIEAYEGPASAKIVVHGNGPGVTTRTIYTVHADEPTKLHISKTFRITGDAGYLSMIPSVWFNYYSMTPYVVNLEDPSKSAGAKLKAFLGRSPTEIADYAQMADLVIATPPGDDTPVTEGGSGKAIAYGWRHISSTRTKADGTVETLPTFALAEKAATAFTTFTNGFWMQPSGNLGLAQMLQMAIMGPEEGDVITIEEELIIGKRADAASITNQLLSGQVVSGSVPAGAEGLVHITTRNGHPITYARPDSAGNFAITLPAGSYTAMLKAAGRDDESRNFDVADEDVALGAVGTAPAASVVLPRGAGPMRLTFLGVGSTPTPDFSDTHHGLSITDQNGPRAQDPMPYIYLAGVEGDQKTAALAPGTYRVLASRGMEYGVSEAELTVTPGATTVLDIAPPLRAVESRGQLNGDFHTHAAPSIDSVMATGLRVTTFIAEGGEIMVAAEHETIFDYAPVLESTGLKGRVIVVNGSEITSEVSSPRNPYSIGHANAFPLTVKPNAWRRGQPMNEGRRWRDVIADTRASWPDTIMQLNHPTKGEKVVVESGGDPQETAGTRGFFLDHMGPAGRQFDPALPLDDPHNSNLIEADSVTGYRDIDFDAVELLNGPWYDSYRMMREMWISWLLQGEIVVGVANSDSHNRAQLVGWPTNLVDMGVDDISAYEETAFVQAVRGGRVVGTTGPVLDVRLDSAAPGDTHKGSAGTLRVSVQAADWVEDPSGAYTLRVSVNGKPVQAGTIKVGEPQNLPLTFEKDAFVLVEVEGEPGETYKLIAPEHKPLAFTNPVFVDADGDGTWTPPGL